RRSGTSHLAGAAVAATTLTKYSVAASATNFPNVWTNSDVFRSPLSYGRAVRKRRVSLCEYPDERPGFEQACESTGDRQSVERHCIANLRQLPPGVAPTAIAPRWSFQLPVRWAKAVPDR